MAPLFHRCHRVLVTDWMEVLPVREAHFSPPASEQPFYQDEVEGKGAPSALPRTASSIPPGDLGFHTPREGEHRLPIPGRPDVRFHRRARPPTHSHRDFFDGGRLHESFFGVDLQSC